jgi:hypothetical protein
MSKALPDSLQCDGRARPELNKVRAEKDLSALISFRTIRSLRRSQLGSRLRIVRILRCFRPIQSAVTVVKLNVNQLRNPPARDWLRQPRGNAPKPPYGFTRLCPAGLERRLQRLLSQRAYPSCQVNRPDATAARPTSSDSRSGWESLASE